MIKQATVHDVNELLNSDGDCQVIDVREFAEYESERLAHAKLMPLSNFAKYADDIDRTKPVYLICRSGVRAKKAAEGLLARGFSDVHVVNGGMMAWKGAALPVVKGESRVWSLERQVRFTAGLLVLIGVVLTLIVHPYFIVIPTFIGAGLTFAGATDWCGMAMLLARMPWNKARGAQFFDTNLPHRSKI
jgi:rhodanese-related sulfurtransferase